mmetsp:Transcript_7677/g.32619  ORF Transcript_7677/g.32619 Transcript_7677/m.32619 type:complete len:220 (-) Transcript_7677:569-1228(-)
MLVTNPRTQTLHRQSRSASRDASFWFFPQIKTIWSFSLKRLSSAFAMSSSLPMPSPPPTNITVCAVSSIPSVARISALGLGGALNAGRIGRPWHDNCLARKPHRMACAATSCVATKHRSTCLWNHVRWHRVRSVTTVANGTLDATKLGCVFMRASTFNGTCCMSGCTETIKSGLYSWNACANLRPTIAVYPVNIASCRILGSDERNDRRHSHGFFTRKK